MPIYSYHTYMHTKKDSHSFFKRRRFKGWEAAPFAEWLEAITWGGQASLHGCSLTFGSAGHFFSGGDSGKGDRCCMFSIAQHDSLPFRAGHDISDDNLDRESLQGPAKMMDSMDCD